MIMKDIHDQTYYELLEVDPSASQEEILKAYNRARATYGHNSPALYSLFNKEEAQELLRLIDEAYAVLSNQFKRKQYDSKHTGTPSFKPSSGDTDHLAIPSATGLPGFAEDSMQMSPVLSAGPVAPAPRSAPAPVNSAASAPHAQKTSGSSDAGMGSTRFGTYKVDPMFEEEIKNIATFSGDVIQRIRLYKNITLDQISDVTKVSRPYLLAIESNNYKALPAPVFVRGFLVQISKILGLDANKVADSFIKLAKEGLPK
jgi:hypothetical protein